MSEILLKLKDLKQDYKKDGFNIVGLFGSYARGDYTEDSDIDLLYEIENPKEFADKFGGFGAFAKLEDIKKEISFALGKKIDLVAKNSLDSVGREFILRDLKDV